MDIIRTRSLNNDEFSTAGFLVNHCASIFHQVEVPLERSGRRPNAIQRYYLKPQGKMLSASGGELTAKIEVDKDGHEDGRLSK